MEKSIDGWRAHFGKCILIAYLDASALVAYFTAKVPASNANDIGKCCVEFNLFRTTPDCFAQALLLLAESAANGSISQDKFEQVVEEIRCEINQGTILLDTKFPTIKHQDTIDRYYTLPCLSGGFSWVLCTKIPGVRDLAVKNRIQVTLLV